MTSVDGVAVGAAPNAPQQKDSRAAHRRPHCVPLALAFRMTQPLITRASLAGTADPSSSKPARQLDGLDGLEGGVALLVMH